jgi:hypothetical protein
VSHEHNLPHDQRRIESSRKVGRHIYDGWRVAMAIVSTRGALFKVIKCPIAYND